MPLPPVSVHRRLPAAVLILLFSALALIGAALPAPARAESAAAPEPIRLVLTTAGLTWEDVSTQETPALQCLAEGSGVAAMNAASAADPSTAADGRETIRTGWRGLAAEAPATAGIPSPPTDLLEELPGDVVETRDVQEARSALDASEEDLVILDLGSVPATGEPGREQAITDVDARAAALIEASGGSIGDGQDCAAALPRTLLVSTGYFPDEASGTDGAGRIMLQVALDTNRPGTALTSGSTHQPGVVILTDVAPTILDSWGLAAPGTVPGQPMTGVEHEDPQLLATDRTQAADRLVRAIGPALVSWVGVGAIGLIILVVPALAGRPRLARIGRMLSAAALIVAPVGLFASVVPWWRTEHPTLALIGVLWAGSLPLAALILAGPWRRRRFAVSGAVAGLVTGGILLESALGSPFQLGSPMGAQAMIGGRYYGISNHLFGLVIGGASFLLLCLLSRVRTPHRRVLVVLGVGSVVTAACVAPSVGADFGSILALVPMFGLLTLLVSGIRLRPWHVLGLGALAAVLVAAVATWDWLRPAEQRTHLGRFVDSVIGGDLGAVILRKLAENWSMTIGYPALLVVVLAAVALSVAVLLPGRLGLRRLEALESQMPAARSVRIALIVGVWIGFLVNDTGAVLVAGALGVWLFLLPVVLPDIAEVEAASVQAADGADPEAC